MLRTESNEQYYKPRGYKRQTSCTVGYTGHYSHPPLENHILSESNTKYMIRGYTGFRPHLQNVVGIPLIPNEDSQRRLFDTIHNDNDMNNSLNNQNNNYTFNQSKITTTTTSVSDFRLDAKRMDTVERYNAAVQRVLHIGQSQEKLLKIVQAKMSERVSNYSHQFIKIRKLFEGLDVNKDGLFDEGQFRVCLEKLNCQFEDFQCLALFAYFDDDNDGLIQWKHFSDVSTIYNPCGSLAMQPKIITDHDKIDLSNDLFKKPLPAVFIHD